MNKCRYEENSNICSTYEENDNNICSIQNCINKASDIEYIKGIDLCDSCGKKILQIKRLKKTIRQHKKKMSKLIKDPKEISKDIDKQKDEGLSMSQILEKGYLI